MKTLFLLRGIPAIGKSYVAKRLPRGLVISADDIRLLHGLPDYCSDDATIPSCNDKEVWKMIYSLAEQRLIRGETTVIDATHCNVKSIKRWENFAREYGVRVYVVDCMSDVANPLELAHAQNQNRKHKANEFAVPAEAIDLMYERYKEPLPKFVSVITDTQMYALLMDNESSCVDYNEKYDEVVIFGDIHGCYSPLKNYFNDHPISKTTKYIFVGDYEDRGAEQNEVYNFVLHNRNASNFLFLQGNHSKHLHAYASDSGKTYYGFNETAKQIVGIPKNELLKFVNRQQPCVYFKMGKNKVFVSHGGLKAVPNGIINASRCIIGDGEYRDSKQVDLDFQNWSLEQKDTIYSVHGHRNIDCEPIQNTSRTFNLEGEVEYGGHLRIVKFSKTGDIETYEYHNSTYVSPDTDAGIVQSLNANEYVKANDVGNGIISYSFTKDAFFSKRWDKTSCRARGLYVRGDKVVARSYSKFFNVGERPETQVDSLLKNMVYPVKGYLKENGFLGIVSVLPEDGGKWFITSKSNPDSPFADYLRSFLNDNGYLTDALKAELLDNDVSMVVEVCNSDVDPHIVHYDAPKITVLELFKNQFSEDGSLSVDLNDFANRHHFEAKKLVFELNDKEDFVALLDKMQNDDLVGIEGYVLVDANNFRVKIKGTWYSQWKKFRSRGNLDSYLKSRLTNEQQEKAVELYQNPLPELKSAQLLSGNQEKLNLTRLIRYVESL